jgi:hypothetical protein
MEDYDGFDPQRQRTATSMRSPDLQTYASGPHWEGASFDKRDEIKNLLKIFAVLLKILNV